MNLFGRCLCSTWVGFIRRSKTITRSWNENKTSIKMKATKKYSFLFCMKINCNEVVRVFLVSFLFLFFHFISVTLLLCQDKFMVCTMRQTIKTKNKFIVNVAFSVVSVSLFFSLSFETNICYCRCYLWNDKMAS